MSAPAPPPEDSGHGPAKPVYWLVRPEDQLDLKVLFWGMTIEPVGDGHELRPGSNGGYVAVLFPPQHLMEPAPVVTSATDPPASANPGPPALGDESRVVFKVAANSPPIPFTVDGILAALTTSTLFVDGRAKPTQPLPALEPGQPAAAIMAAAAERREAQRTGSARTPGPRPIGAVAERARRAEARLGLGEAAPATETTQPAEPTPTPTRTPTPGATTGSPEPDDSYYPYYPPPTWMQFPSRLVTTPRSGATMFSHSAQPVTRDGRTELWHTRLAQRRVDGSPAEVRDELYVLSRDEIKSNKDTDWGKRVADARIGGALTESIRDKLVDLYGNKPLTVDQLMLSSLGAWLDAQRHSAEVSYQHLMAMGRDLKVRTVEYGRLFPFGHKAKLVRTTSRVFDKDNGMPARLLTRWVVTVMEPVKDFTTNTPGERAFPWRRVRLLTTVTPNIERKAFTADSWELQIGTTEFQFRCLGVDWGWRTSTFRLPLIFVEDDADLSAVVNKYRQRTPSARTVRLDGQTVSTVEPGDDAPEAADVVADSMVINLVTEKPNPNGPTIFTSTVDLITGKLPSLQRFVPSLANTSLDLNYAGPYTSHGFGGGNAGQLVLQLANNQVLKLVDLADKAVTGGLATPSFSVNAVSRLAGLVGGDNLSNLASTGKVTVKNLLKQTVGDVKLLGVFPLVDLIGPDLELSLAGTDPLRRVPQLVTDAIDGVSTPSFHWEAPLFTNRPDGVPATDVGPVGGSLSPLGSGQSKLVIDVKTELEEPVVVTAPKMHITATCKVENVKLTMAALNQKLVEVPFKHIMFESRDGKKPDFDVDLGEIEFFGVLAFVRTLAALIPQDGFHDPPALDITDEKISSSFALPIPSVAVGMFSLENITFGAALDLWYAKPPELRLNFATFDNRFRLAVLCLGGGGYLGVVLSTKGLEGLDGALEFGAALAVDLGVARGSVSVMGGIHFFYDRETEPALTGYLDVRGEVEVLKVLTVGVNLFMALTWYPQSGELSGYAHLEAYVKVLFFKKTVRVPFEYTFIGAGGGDGSRQQALPTAPVGLPGFLDQMAPPDWPRGTRRPWDTYCLAFA